MFKTALTPEERLIRVRQNIVQRNIPLLAGAEDNEMSVAICGFGPSLADTWRDVVKSDVVMSTSGAHDFLIANGVVPTYHVECDPREHKARFVRNSHPDVIYCINSQCHPLMFDALSGRQVRMWHGFTDDDVENQVSLVESLSPGARLLAGGTSVGTRAIVVARELGFRRFDLHGMDCCYRGSVQWAGEHYTSPHRTVLIDVDGVVFETSDLMMQATDDFFNMLPMLPDCSFRIHGGGLLEARLRMYLRDSKRALSWGWWTPLNFTVRAA